MSKKQSDVIDLGKLLGVFWDQRRLIGFSTLLFAGLGLTYSLLAPSIYSANAAVQVEEKYTGGALRGLSSIFEQESTAATEIAVLKSRAILSKAVDELNLSTQIAPIYTIPFLSKGWEKLMGEKPELVISRFIPKQEDLREMTLEIGSDENHYFLVSKEGQVLLEGVVGRKYDNDDVEIQVTDLKGSTGSRFSIEKINELTAVELLQKTVAVEEKGKQTGVIELTLNGENKEYIGNVLRSITESYLRHSTARNSAEAEKSLRFLQNRLPEVRGRLADSENALNDYRQKTASVDLGLEAKSLLDTLVQLDANLNTLTIKESEISQRFTKRHPTYIALLEQRKILQTEKARLSKQLEELPETQKDIVRLTRDFEVDQQIYTQLLNKIQELDVVKAGAVGNVRILDPARVMPDPIAPRTLIILLFSMIFGFMLGCAVVILRSFLHNGIKSLAEVTEAGLITYATIPHSDKQAEQSLSKLESKRGARSKNLGLLSDHYPNDLSIEALRGLRTSLSFMLMEAPNNLVMFSGITQAAGKTFISANFANILAKTDKKVLLIDADLRRSYLHYLLDLDNNAGLSELLSQNIPFEQAIKTLNGNLDVITRGVIPPNPSELLSSTRCKQLLDWASAHYDVVIIDVPPILAVTDAAVIGRYVGTTLLIGRFEKTTQKEIEVSRQRFENAGVRIKGFILNDIKARALNKDDYFHSRYA